jgi:hypothetical protein
MWTMKLDDELVRLTPRDNGWPLVLAALVASGFALRTCCTRGLGLCPRYLLRSWARALGTRCAHGLAVLVALGFALGTAALMASGFALGTCCARGLGLCPRDSLRSWPRASPSGLFVLVAKGFALGTCCACGLWLHPRDSLHSWPWALPSGLTALEAFIASGFTLRTHCAHGRGLCPQVSHQGLPWGLALVVALVGFAPPWPWTLPSELAALVASGFALGTRCA